MAEQMLAYIHEQTTVLRAIMRWQNAILAGFRDAYEVHRWSRIIAVGSGSSHNAACCVKVLFAQVCGVEVIPCVPTQLVPVLLTSDKAKTLVMLISQSGESTSTLGILHSLKEEGWQTLGLTQLMSSPIAGECDHAVELHCGEEKVGPKTKGFTATVLTLQLMALNMARIQGQTEQAARHEKRLAEAIERIPEQIARSLSWLDSASDVLKHAPHLLLLGCDDARYALMEGALKLLETLYIPCVSYEFEEYLHGVQCTIGEGSELILAVPDDARRERMLKLAAFNEAHGGHSLVIALGGDVAFPGSLKMDGASDFTAVYSLLILLQVISAQVSAQKGINCDHPKFPGFVRDLNTKTDGKVQAWTSTLASTSGAQQPV